MKSLFKYVIYAVVIVGILLVSLDIFKYHPEAQFAFIFPGIFLLAFSSIMDDTLRGIAQRIRIGRGR